jgi:hypothetical protein
MGTVLTNLNEQTDSKEISESKEKWLAIKTKTIDEYYNTFIEFLKKQMRFRK